MVKSKSAGDKAVDIIAYIVLSFLALLCLFPLLHTVALSFSDSAAAMAGKVVLLPVRFTMVAYEEILKDIKFFSSFFVSVKRVLLGVSINMLLIILTAFPLSKSTRIFPQKNIFIWYLVFSMLFSGGLIPNYLVVNELGLLDSIWALVLPGSVQVFNVIILMNFFKGLPDELDEAARIDGANPWIVLFKIYLPLSLPSLATVGLFCIVRHWNSFFDGIVYINSVDKKPLQTYIQQLVVEVGQQNLALMSPEEIERLSKLTSKTFNAAKIFVTTIPILLIYPFIQRFFVTGLVVGSVKG